jgi:Flp pilus assembly protein TadB
MEFLIALLIGLLVYLIAYNLLYRSQLRLTDAEKRVNAAFDTEAVLREANPKSPEYKLAAAGLRTTSPQLTWLLLTWGPGLVLLAAALAFGLPPLVAGGLALVGLVAPRSWLDGRIKDRGRRIDADLPQVYVELLAILRANPDIASALAEVAEGLEQEKGPGPITSELRLTASEAASSSVGREQALRNLQERAASVSLANLGLLLERFAQTGAGHGGSFFEAFMAGASNVQSILEARQKAQSKAAEQMQSARLIPVLLVLTLFFFMNDASFRASFKTPLVQIALAGAAGIMYVGYLVMGDMAREAV